MKTRTFLAKLKVRIGDYENLVSLLLVANSQESAEALLDDAAALYYGEGDMQKEDGGYYANHGEVHISASTLVEIGLATFLDLQGALTVRCASNVNMPTSDLLSESVQEAAKSLHNALKAKAEGLTQSDVLNALASSWGEKNWQVLKAKLQAPEREAYQGLAKAADTVVSWADSEGCSDDLTVTSAEGVKRLSNALTALRRMGHQV